MSLVTATFATKEEAQDARTRVVGVGVDASRIHLVPDHATGGTHDESAVSRDLEAAGVSGRERDDLIAAIRAGNHAVVADVPAEHLVEAEEVIRGNARTRDDAGQEIAPGGKPAAAVGATSTIGIADDGQQTYSDPLDDRVD